MKPPKPTKSISNQTVGNIGLYFACYQLSLLGWNAMPTARNARGIDIVAYNQVGNKVLTFQVKSLSKRNAVPLGATMSSLVANYVIVVGLVTSANPHCHVMKPREVKRLSEPHKGAFWLPPRAYECFEDIGKRIGPGAKRIVGTDRG